MPLVRLKYRVRRDRTGLTFNIPVVWSNESGALLSLVAYLLKYSEVRSQSWMDKVCLAVETFLEYLQAHSDKFANNPGGLSRDSQIHALFDGFVARLYSGTIDADGRDPTHLCWRARRVKTANSLISALSQFSDWLAKQNRGYSLNPYVMPSGQEERLFWAAFENRLNRAFNAHIWNKRPEPKTRRTFARRVSVVQEEAAKAFPESQLGALLTRGFIVPGRQGLGLDGLNLRDILITILQHFGGIRMSEAFHLYVYDVDHDDLLEKDGYSGIARVRIHHPTQGLAPHDWIDLKNNRVRGTREEYLRLRWGLRSRTQYHSGSGLHAGWKHPILDDQERQAMYVFWFPLVWGRVFYSLWRYHLLRLRDIECKHPFAFVNFDGPTVGEPYTINAYRQNHASAVKRLGLTPTKNFGTTPHGHRHAYGRRLVKYKIDPLTRRRALHHVSVESQLTYVEPSWQMVSQTLTEAHDRLQQGEKANVTKPALMGFEDVDPLGLLSGWAPLLLEGRH
jgi:hypothetical protein